MGCEFNLRVTGIAIDKAFDRSLGQGIIQIGNEIKNVFTRTEEIIEPQEAYFKTPLEIRDNKIYWQNYDRSISNSMLRNVALLRLNKAPKEEIKKAKTEWKMWKRMEEKILNLGEGQAVQWLALRGVEAEEGVALQQVSRQDGQLVLESELMPFNQVEQIDRFRDLIQERGEDISLPAEEGIDPEVNWVIQGQAINFQEELPEIINDIKVTPSSFTVPAYRPARQTWLSAMSPVKDSTFNIKKMNQEEDRIIATGFWFAAMKWQELSQKAQPERIISEALPARSLLVGMDKKILEEEISRKDIKSAKTYKVQPCRFEDEVIVVQKTEINKRKMSIQIPIRNGMTEAVNLKKSTRILSEPKRPEMPVKPTRIILEDRKPEIQTSRRDLEVKQPMRTEFVGIVEKQIPIYLVKGLVGSLKEIPEWIWQGQGVLPEEFAAWQWLLVIIFHALSNTKIQQSEKILVKIS